jgi:two-component system OmpR family sensor kinase
MNLSEHLGRVPLRVKLVAAVLALVTLALLAISSASTVAVRDYLVDRVDRQMEDQLAFLVHLWLERGFPVDPRREEESVLPSDVQAGWVSPGGSGRQLFDRRYDAEDLPPLPGFEEASEREGEAYTVDARGGHRRWRMVATVLPSGYVIAVGQDMSEVDTAVGRLMSVEFVVGGGVLLLLGVAGVAAVRASLRPLGEIERTADAIAAGDLTRRVPDPEPGVDPPRTEVGRLSRAFNAMVTQIEAAFAARAASEQRMRQFVADASHELRTPLTTIRGFAELHRQGAVGSPEERDGLVRRIEAEASRMGLLVEDLLLLARLDQERPLELAPVELPVVVADAVHAARVLDPERPIELDVRSDGVPLVVRGDDHRLRQVVSNLLNNGLTHTPAGTPMAVRLRAEAGTAVIEVSDQGPGLTPEQRDRVFERFYRVDKARSRPSGGNNGSPPGGGTGLGLAIVAALVAAHRGTVEVESVPGEGATFRVRLPLEPLQADEYAGDMQDGYRRVKG